MSTYRVGLDIGGTFTDFVLYDGAHRRISLHKCLTTPHDPSVAALAGLGELAGEAGIAIADIGEIIHGTTLVTNAIIERRGAKVGLLTTQGFRDVLEMGTEQRYDIYDLFLKFPAPLVPRRRRVEIPERMDARGHIVTPLDLDARRAASSVKASRPSPSVSFTPIAARCTSAPPRSCWRLSFRNSPCRSRVKWWRSCGNIRARSPPAPTPMCSRSWRITSRGSNASLATAASAAGSI